MIEPTVIPIFDSFPFFLSLFASLRRPPFYECVFIDVVGIPQSV